ncbi:Sec-independent protein translocase protein TatB [Roseinatronobacter sp. S2]|uniref:Sec-independent protein translocase protein TatB n=1 Tax=Roseinatronobacter sp. S2 TaxID=3035471 RepID=UPI00241018B9|nr:Sec-independent protein translocase protein TatB [Roseinatronobacter sp. S2]WFE76366.1 Sec-independent protein translocase protein TatB [Roseinatronobacter sp. S2]
MLDIGWTELLVIGVVALIVVGPKDLPKMFRTLGQFTAKARNMAREFQRAMDEAADESGVKDVARDLRGMTDPKKMGMDELDKLRNWDPMKPDAPSKGKKTGPAADTSNADASNDEDEAELDEIAAEMEQVRQDRAPKADAGRGRTAKASKASAPPDTPDVAPKDDTASKA